jgi:hypothetical protein
MRHRRDRAAAEVGWNVGDRLVEVHVGTAAPEEVEEVFAEGLVRIRSHGCVLGSAVQFKTGLGPNKGSSPT